MPGVATILNLYPSEQTAIVVLLNRSHGAAVQRISSAIAAAALPRYAAVRDERRLRFATSPRPLGPTPFAPPADVVGNWSGRLLVLSDTLPFTLSIEADGRVRTRLGTTETVVAGAAFNRGWLSGRFIAPLRAPDATPAAEHERTSVALSLRRRGDQLTGWASSVTLGPVAYGAVSYRAELRRN
jgi:hypothetical protein